MSPDLVLLGNLIVDDVVLEDGTTRMGQPGGALLYGALAAALCGARAAVCAPRGADYPQAALDALAARGVDLAGLRPLGRPGLRTWLLYEPHARRVLHRLGCPTHAEASPGAADLPAGWAGARAFHVAPIPLECQRPLIAALAARPGAWVSLDPHDPITEESLGRWREALAGADLLFVSEEELRLAGPDPVGRLRRLAGGRLAFVLLKRGARGGLLCEPRSGRSMEWPPWPGAVVDPTGAGDAFAAGFLAHLIAAGLRPADGVPERELRAALDQGAAAASFALDSWGSDALAAATAEMLRARREAPERPAAGIA